MNTHASLRRVSVALLAASTVASQLAMAASDSATLLVGGGSASCPDGPGISNIDGYVPGLPIGSYSPTGLTGGKTVAVVMDRTTNCIGMSSIAVLEVSGFASSPGANWLSSITCNGVTNNATTSLFSYVAGTGYWVWFQPFGLLSKVGINVSCTIVHG